ncbi:hypothetical protein K7432_000533 [Basidiobolus ranarum]|uniref:GATA-type domain-containing protein n=1 Tax=Basidiobolus ranarum TaxID=34480 RepID=A0ABR2WB46_9FUNG
MSATQRTCFWALLSTSNLAFVYISSSLRDTLQNDNTILGTCFYDYLHPSEYAPAKRDISRSIEQRDLLGSVTRCQFRNIFLSHPLARPGRKASIAVSSQPENKYHNSRKPSLPPSPTFPVQTRSPRSYFGSSIPTHHNNEPKDVIDLDDEEEQEGYLVMDITLNVVCDGVVLGIFHPIEDEQQNHVCGQQNYDAQDIDNWAQCVRYLSEQDRQLGHSRHISDVPLTPNTPQSPSYKAATPNSFVTSISTNSASSCGRIFFILDSKALSPLLCWPEETFCKLTGAQQVPPPGSRGVLEHHLKPEDLYKIKEHLGKAPPTDGCLCIQRYSGKHSMTHMDGSLQYIQCIVIPYGSVTFACFQSVAPLLSNFAAQQPLQLTLPPDTKPAISYAPPTSMPSMSHLLNHPQTTTSEMPLTPCSPSVHGGPQMSPDGSTSGEFFRMYPYYPRNSHNRASLPSLPTLRDDISDPNFNANRRASEPHTTFARPRDKMNITMSSSLSQIPENQVSSPLSPNKRISNEQSSGACLTLGKKFRSEQEDLRVRVLGRNHSESDIFMPMDHPGINRRHSSPVPHRDSTLSNASLPPISQLVEPQPHHPTSGLAYSQSPLPHVMSTPVGVRSQTVNQFRSSNPGHHIPPLVQGYAMTRGGVPISFLHSTTTVQKRCESCNTSQSPEWRRGPTGHKTLCNACGLRYSRSIARAGKQQQKTNTTTPTSNSNITRSITNFPVSSTSHLRPNAMSQPTPKSGTLIERSSAHQYSVSHSSYSRPVHIPSSLPSSSGNARENR